jgi:hypothetical protein
VRTKWRLRRVQRPRNYDQASVNPGTLAPGETGSFGGGIFASPFAVGPGWTYRLFARGVPQSTTPPEVGRGILQLAGDQPYTGAPPVARTGVELLYLYPQKRLSNLVEFHGELRNSTDQPVEAPEIAATFYDAAGKIVDSVGPSSDAEALVRVIPPGGTAPIDVWTSLEFGEWARLTFVLGPSGPVDPSTVAQGLTLERVKVERSANRLVVTGEVVNGGDRFARHIVIRALIYDADGRFADHNSAFVKTMSGAASFDSRLKAGERGSFELEVDVDAGPDWTYRLVVEGMPPNENGSA